MNKVYLAADFGGGSGRVIAGWLEDGQLKMEEVHRFGNRQVRLGNHVYWDFPALFEDMKAGLKKAAAKGYKVESIGVDTWGVDYVLLDESKDISSPVYSYRDSRVLKIAICTSWTHPLARKRFRSKTPQHTRCS